MNTLDIILAAITLLSCVGSFYIFFKAGPITVTAVLAANRKDHPLEHNFGELISLVLLMTAIYFGLYATFLVLITGWIVQEAVLGYHAQAAKQVSVIRLT